jgi:hypothetical protein
VVFVKDSFLFASEYLHIISHCKILGFRGDKDMVKSSGLQRHEKLEEPSGMLDECIGSTVHCSSLLFKFSLIFHITCTQFGITFGVWCAQVHTLNIRCLLYVQFALRAGKF